MGSTVYHLSAALAAKGHTVTVITRSGGGKPPRVDGVTVAEVPWARIPMEFTRSYGRWALRALEKLHEREPVDVIHVHAPLLAWNEKQFKRARGISPVITSLHGSWKGEARGLVLGSQFGEEGARWNVNDIAIRRFANHYAKFENIAINHSDICVANSVATRNDFETNYSPPNNWDCETILWGVDTGLYRPLHLDSEDDFVRSNELRKRYGADQETNLILAVGRLAARKGHTMLIRAFAKVVKESPDSHLLIVGRGGLRSKLLRLARVLGINEHVSIESGMSFEELGECLSISDLVCYPSYYEGQGLVPLEAMAAGTPCLTFDLPPLTEMIDGEVGGLCEMSEDSLAESMLSMLSSGELIAKGAAGRRRVLDLFTLEGNADAFLAVYERAIGDSGRRGNS
jgi:glycosyltransferase involved in cell wall biosynthesis